MLAPKGGRREPHRAECRIVRPLPRRATRASPTGAPRRLRKRSQRAERSEAMTQYEPEPSGWAAGGVVFAGAMMIMIGIFQAIAGLAAIADDGFFVVTRNYAFDLDPGTWGWIHLALGIAIALAGYFLLVGRVWAGMVAI